MRYRSLLAPIGAPEIARPILETALHLARRFDAHIEILHVRPDPRGLVPYTGEGMDGSMIEEIMEATEREGEERALRSRELVDALAMEHGLRFADAPDGGPGVTLALRTLVGREDEAVAVEGRLYDLLVVGRPIRDSALPSPITLEAALLDTGRPILVAPPTPPASVADTIAIAWEGSPEAARTIADAIPLLEGAQAVHILAADAAQVSPVKPEALQQRLSWHGIGASIHRFDCAASDLGAAFLEHSGALGADLLVKGAYSQSRLRQLILGGRTRHILARSEIPVLLAH